MKLKLLSHLKLFAALIKLVIVFLHMQILSSVRSAFLNNFFLSGLTLLEANLSSYLLFHFMKQSNGLIGVLMIHFYRY